MNKEREYYVYNATPEKMNKVEAENFIKHFRERFSRQGYYLTFSMRRIPVEELKLELEEAE